MNRAIVFAFASGLCVLCAVLVHNSDGVPIQLERIVDVTTVQGSNGTDVLYAVGEVGTVYLGNGYSWKRQGNVFGDLAREPIVGIARVNQGAIPGLRVITAPGNTYSSPDGWRTWYHIGGLVADPYDDQYVTEVVPMAFSSN